MNNYINRLIGACGIVLPAVFTLIIAISVIQNPWFSWETNAISDLGASDGSLTLFNTGLIITGALLLILSIGVVLNFKEKHGPTILFSSSILLILIGFVPIPNVLHIPISWLFFITYNAAFLTIGSTVLDDRNTSFERSMKLFAIFVCIASIFALIFFIFYEWIAISEIIAIYPGLIWSMIFSIRLLRRGSNFLKFDLS